MSLSDVKDYLRVDGTANDNIIEGLISAAKTILKEVVGKDFFADDEIEPLAELFIKKKVRTFYFPDYQNENGLNSMLVYLKDIAKGGGSL